MGAGASSGVTFGREYGLGAHTIPSLVPSPKRLQMDDEGAHDIHDWFIINGHGGETWNPRKRNGTGVTSDGWEYLRADSEPDEPKTIYIRFCLDREVQAYQADGIDVLIDSWARTILPLNIPALYKLQILRGDVIRDVLFSIDPRTAVTQSSQESVPSPAPEYRSFRKEMWDKFVGMFKRHKQGAITEQPPPDSPGGQKISPEQVAALDFAARLMKKRPVTVTGDISISTDWPEKEFGDWMEKNGGVIIDGEANESDYTASFDTVRALCTVLGVPNPEFYFIYYTPDGDRQARIVDLDKFASIGTHLEVDVNLVEEPATFSVAFVPCPGGGRIIVQAVINGWSRNEVRVAHILASWGLAPATIDTIINWQVSALDIKTGAAEAQRFRGSSAGRGSALGFMQRFIANKFCLYCTVIPRISFFGFNEVDRANWVAPSAVFRSTTSQRMTDTPVSIGTMDAMEETDEKRQQQEQQWQQSTPTRVMLQFKRKGGEWEGFNANQLPTLEASLIRTFYTDDGCPCMGNQGAIYSQDRSQTDLLPAGWIEPDMVIPSGGTAPPSGACGSHHDLFQEAEKASFLKSRGAKKSQVSTRPQRLYREISCDALLEMGSLADESVGIPVLVLEEGLDCRTTNLIDTREGGALERMVRLEKSVDGAAARRSVAKADRREIAQKVAAAALQTGLGNIDGEAKMRGYRTKKAAPVGTSLQVDLEAVKKDVQKSKEELKVALASLGLTEGTLVIDPHGLRMGHIPTGGNMDGPIVWSVLLRIGAVPGQFVEGIRGQIDMAQILRWQRKEVSRDSWKPKIILSFSCTHGLVNTWDRYADRWRTIDPNESPQNPMPLAHLAGPTGEGMPTCGSEEKGGSSAARRNTLFSIPGQLQRRMGGGTRRRHKGVTKINRKKTRSGKRKKSVRRTLKHRGPRWLVGTSGFMVNRNLWLTLPGLNCIEINSTFYGLPSRKVVSNWRNLSSDLMFSVKASKYITHIKRLKGVKAAWNKFWIRMKGLGPQMQAVLIQLPPSFKNNPVNLARVEAMGKYLPKGGPTMVFEFRDSSWFVPAVYNLMRKYKLTLGGTAIRRPTKRYWLGDLPTGIHIPPRTSNATYIRIHGAKGYRGYYDKKQLAAIRRGVKSRGTSKNFVMFNNTFFDSRSRSCTVKNKKIRYAAVCDAVEFAT